MSIAAPLQVATSKAEHSNPSAGGGFLQRKLAIAASNDPLEYEADRVADQVLRMPEPQVLRKECSSPECKEEDKDNILQAKSIDSARPVQIDHPLIKEVLSSPGQPLDADTRNYMEPRFGRDFSGVRVHTDGQAAESARAANARAYTVGRHVVFGAQQYFPETQSGKRLIAHELTHLVQQSPGSARNTHDRCRAIHGLSPNYSSKVNVWGTSRIVVQLQDDKERAAVFTGDYENFEEALKREEYKTALELLNRQEIGVILTWLSKTSDNIIRAFIPVLRNIGGERLHSVVSLYSLRIFQPPKSDVQDLSRVIHLLPLDQKSVIREWVLRHCNWTLMYYVTYAPKVLDDRETFIVKCEAVMTQPEIRKIEGALVNAAGEYGEIVSEYFSAYGADDDLLNKPKDDFEKSALVGNKLADTSYRRSKGKTRTLLNESLFSHEKKLGLVMLHEFVHFQRHFGVGGVFATPEAEAEGEAHGIEFFFAKQSNVADRINEIYQVYLNFEKKYGTGADAEVFCMSFRIYYGALVVVQEVISGSPVRQDLQFLWDRGKDYARRILTGIVNEGAIQPSNFDSWIKKHNQEFAPRI